MASYTRDIGYTFTNQEVLDFWHDPDGPGGVVTVEVCDHVKPGTPLNLPFWSGFQIVQLSNGDVLEQIPDATAPHDFGRLIFRGSHLGDTEIAELVIDMITRQQLEVAVAFEFHFDPVKFGEDAQSLENLRRRFWSTWTGLSMEQRAIVDARLLQEDRAYALMVAFLSEPRHPQFRGLVESAVNGEDLGILYQLADD